MRRASFAVPGSLDIPTGGYAYDRCIIAELRKLGWLIDVIDLGGGFPTPTDEVRAVARKRLMSVPLRQPIIFDGLAYGVLPEAASELSQRNPLIALVHHPLALEWGVRQEQAEVFRATERAALACAHAVIATSATTARTLVSDYDVPAERITVARPGTDPKARARGSGGHLQLLSVGAVVPRKGFDVLVAALARLAERSWQLTIVGDLTRDVRAVAALQTGIKRHGLDDRIAVLGAISDTQLAAIFDKADIFVLASYHEGYGMAYAEALAHGLPVIGTTAGAIPETIPDGAGILVPPGDARALAEALRTVIDDAGLRLRLSSAAAAIRLPSWAQSAAIFADVLERLQ